MERRSLGTWGEKRAAAYLRLRGYRILCMNYSQRGGEIDIIARKGKFIVFAEVKLRKNADFAEAREFVHAAKQQRIINTALMYLAQNADEELQPRFDVIEIYAPEGERGRIKINHIPDAFS